MMAEPERRHGVIRISIDSIIKAIYGNTEYEAVNMRISKIDRRMLEITVSHPALPIWKQGQKLPKVNIERKYQQDDE
jgi:hypothetical protein